MGIGVLGPLEINGRIATLGPRDRVVLEALAVEPGVFRSADALADALWGDDPPVSAAKNLQGCIVRLRKALGASVIETAPAGYRLVLRPDDVDHRRFEELVDRAQELSSHGEPARASYLVGEALALWRGAPFTDLQDWDPGRIEAERLLELRRDAEELSVEADLASGRQDQVLVRAARLVREAPVRERRWGLLALAQYQAGRQAEALETIQRAKAMLARELGLDPGPGLVELEQGILRQDPGLAAAVSSPEPSLVCPYVGLLPYDVGDTDGFFGREADVVACLERLDSVRVLAVVGPSGTGKSSLVRAGVAAALRRDGHEVVVITPGSAGTSIAGLAQAGTVPYLVVDQCEEALNLAESDAGRRSFFESVTGFARHGRLVISLRADRLGELSVHPEFARLVEKGLYLLGPMGPDELRAAIERPATQAGLHLEPGLTDLLIREVEGEPGALPMLSHALRQTWERREGETLTVVAYRDSGGIRGAVSQTAEQIYREATPEQQEMLRETMLRLVAPDPGGDPVPTRVPRSTVAADDTRAELVERLIGARLLSSDDTSVVIAHEALARVWPRLRSWLDDDVAGQQVLRHLTVATVSWEDMGRPDSELYRGARQARAEEWRTRTQPHLTDTEATFLDASRELAVRENRALEEQVRRERRSVRRLRGSLAGVAAFLAVALVAVWVAVVAGNRAEDQALVADSRAMGAEALRTEDLDRALLLGVLGYRLRDSAESRNNLLATLDRAPTLIGVEGTEATALGVNPITGQLALAGASERGLAIHDGSSLRRTANNPDVVGFWVRWSPSGDMMAASLGAHVVGRSPVKDRAVWLLDDTAAPLPTQLGGQPAASFVLEALSFSPNGRWLAAEFLDLAGEKPPVVGIWDVRRPTRPEATVEVGGSFQSLQITDDGRRMFTAADGILRVSELPSGRELHRLSPEDLSVRELNGPLQISPDGRTLAVAAGPDAVLLDIATLQPKAWLNGHGFSEELSFAPSGDRFAATGDRLVAWDVSGPEPRELLSEETWGSNRVGFSPDGRTLYSAGGNVLARDLEGDRRFLANRPGDLLAGGSMISKQSPDGGRVAYLVDDGGNPALRVRELETGRLGPVVRIGQPITSWIDLAWSPDGTAVVPTTGHARVPAWDAVNGRWLGEGSVAPAGASTAEYAGDGQHLLVGSTDGAIHVLDAKTFAPVRPPIDLGEEAISSLRASPDGRHVVAFTDVGGAQVVDHEAGRVVRDLDVGPAVWSPDGRRIFATGPLGEVGLLDAGSYRWISEPNTAEPFSPYSVAFSPDGSRVAAQSDDRVGLWDGRSGKFLGAVRADDNGTVGFTPDGSEVIIAENNGSVREWSLDPEDWVEAACRIVGRDITSEEWETYLDKRDKESVCPD